MKFTKQHEKALREFMGKMDEMGCLSVDKWTSGTGRFTTNRALPPFVKRYDKSKCFDHGEPRKTEPGTIERLAVYYFNQNPRRKSVLIIDQDALYDFLFSAAHLKEF